MEVAVCEAWRKLVVEWLRVEWPKAVEQIRLPGCLSRVRLALDRPPGALSPEYSGRRGRWGGVLARLCLEWLPRRRE